MKSICRITLVATLVFAISCNGKAQDTKEAIRNSTPEQRAQALTDTLRSLLGLSDEQYTSVYKVNLDVAKKNSVNMQSNESKLSKFKKFKASQEERDASFQKILTPEQFDLYKQKENKLMDKMKQRAANMRN